MWLFILNKLFFSMKSLQDIIKDNFEIFDDLYNKLFDIFSINKNNISNKKLLIAVSG